MFAGKTLLSALVLLALVLDTRVFAGRAKSKSAQFADDEERDQERDPGADNEDDNSPFQMPWDRQPTRRFGPPPPPPPPAPFASPFAPPVLANDNEDDLDEPRRPPVYWVPNPWIKIVEQASLRREKPQQPQQESGPLESYSQSQCDCSAKSFSSSSPYDRPSYGGDDNDPDVQQNEAQRRPKRQMGKTNGRSTVTYKGEELTDDNLDFVCTRYFDEKRGNQQQQRRYKSPRSNSKRRETKSNQDYGTKGGRSSSGRAFQAQYQKPLPKRPIPPRSNRNRSPPTVRSAYYN